MQEGSIEEVESQSIRENLSKVEGIDKPQVLVEQLMNLLNTAKDQGEKVYDFEARIREGFQQITASKE